VGFVKPSPQQKNLLNNTIMFDIPSLANVPTGSAPSTDLPPRPLLTPHPTIPNDYVLQLDNTTSEYFQTCPRSAYYYTVLRRQSPGRAALDFGGAIHAGLEELYRTKFTSLDSAKLKTLQYFASKSYDPGDDYRTPFYATSVIEQYYNHYSLSDTISPVTLNDGTLAVERAFALNLGSFEVNATLPFTRKQLLGVGCSDPDFHLFIATLHVQWTGKIDIISSDPFTSIPEIVDHKTSSMEGDNFYKEFILSQQTRGYCWAASRILNRPVRRFRVNALFIRKPTRTGKNVTFDRRAYTYQDSEIDEWETEIKQTLANYIHALTTNTFPRYTKWCVGKYGACQYHQVCSLPAHSRDAMIASPCYTNVTWSPLHDV